MARKEFIEKVKDIMYQVVCNMDLEDIMKYGHYLEKDLYDNEGNEIEKGFYDLAYYSDLEIPFDKALSENGLAYKDFEIKEYCDIYEYGVMCLMYDLIDYFEKHY